MVAGVTVTVDDERIRQTLRRLQGRIGDLRPAMGEIGGALEASTIHRFETQTGPDGEPWKPSGRAVRDRGQTLTDTGRLKASITHRVGVGGDSVAVGTNVVYAGIHQFGGRTPARVIRARQKEALWWPGAAHPVKAVRHPGSDVPARPFLGLDAGDERAIVAIVERHAEASGNA